METNGPGLNRSVTIKGIAEWLITTFLTASVLSFADDSVRYFAAWVDSFRFSDATLQQSVLCPDSLLNDVCFSCWVAKFMLRQVSSGWIVRSKWDNSGI
jgi:hypothetical protein